ncbi:DUF4350 domain-containing protein [Peterkaempfera bronchialis]|uniref:DUF4350 domain-containing protein n=1 Tax=Peterkaempfera bronchialis TaxID=2126346 RepID=A0A345SVP7_9ACTN|nr:DUF4350 domain-containing protein [Peterkaempfera bronchialis]AXI77802.1 DUF4350 domain-containing protein [Peterkaempfera bronchialis]
MTSTAPTSPAPTAPAPTAPASTSLAPTAARLWQRWRGLTAAALVLVLGGLLYAGLRGDTRYPPLDPRSAAHDGARAITRLLERQGVAVDTAPGAGRALDDGRPTTVLLTGAETLTRRQLQELGRTVHTGGGRIVLLAPGPAELAVLAPGTRIAGPGGNDDDAPMVPSASAAPGCALPEARRAGTAELGGLLYNPAARAQGCYPRLGMPALVWSPEGAGDTVVLGSGRFLTNDRLDDDGNAALALGLLGAHQRLVWYLPDYDHSGASDGDQSLLSLLPAGWRWGLLQATVAALLAALWRARRLGPVVAENLPVVVRAAETTEGRARLYRRARARGRAADVLRAAARSRLGATLGLPTRPEPDPAALAAAVTARLPGDRTPAEVHALLYGAAPADDAALLRLADDLDTLERQVRQP